MEFDVGPGHAWLKDFAYRPPAFKAFADVVAAEVKLGYSA